jgi:hypothetical protein
MLVRALSLVTTCCLQMVGSPSPARALTLAEIVARLETAGYSQIRQLPSGKIKTFKAVKDGKEASIMIDSTGHIKELQ